jgi:hypothetical protein
MTEKSEDYRKVAGGTCKKKDRVLQAFVAIEGNMYKSGFMLAVVVNSFREFSRPFPSLRKVNFTLLYVT